MPITRYTIRNTQYENGFTMVELLVALIVSSIILAAVATLAFAMSTANVSTDDTSIKQAQVRFATLRISELIRHCKLICAAPGNDLVIWKADDNEDSNINVLELAYIEKGNNSDRIRVLEFTRCPLEWLRNQSFQVIALQQDWLKALFVSLCQEAYAQLIPQCSNVEFYAHLDNPSDPLPKAKRITITFDLAENDIIHQYQISAALRCWAGNLLNEDGTAIVSDDD